MQTELILCGVLTNCRAIYSNEISKSELQNAKFSHSNNNNSNGIISLMSEIYTSMNISVYV